MSTDRRDELAREHEHLWLSDLRKHPNGEARLFSADGKLISGTYAFQVTSSVDAMVRAATCTPRSIETTEGLDALQEGSIILDAGGMGAQWDGEMWSGEGRWWHSAQIELPATVLHEPKAEVTP